MSENKEKTKRKAPPHAFKKGQSGNPAGRPKKNPEVSEILKAASPDAAKRLVELIKDSKSMIALLACKEILDRTQGKPESVSKVHHSGGLDLDVGVKKKVLAMAKKLAMEATHEP